MSVCGDFRWDKARQALAHAQYIAEQYSKDPRTKYAPLVCPPVATRYERKLFSRWKQRHGGAGCWGIYKWRSSIRKDIVRAKLALVRCKGRPPDPRVPHDMPKHVRERYQRFQRKEGRCTFAAWWRWQQGGPYPLVYL